ncbi:MAG: aminotransferase class V-fold PLP-dependent enzyme [Planctomycetes bacterium]|nr:aminotransferase class V-fold PLP-dependent enzyme [Planctomycetota bacterium]
MSEPRRLYLDNAATSFPKPPGVYAAMMDYGQRVGASPGRGHYAESREGARLIRRCRERINQLFNGESADHVVMALNTSDALNLAIKGIVRHRRLEGGPVHVVTTAMDHNSVLRPFSALAGEGVQVTHVGADEQTGYVEAGAVAAAIRPETALVAVNMASNVSGVIQPVAEIGAVCRRAGVVYLVDAAQAAGHVPIDVRAMQIDLLAFPGHKGLMGPQGTGGLYIRPGVEKILATTREGGTGSWSESDSQPASMPEKYEAGSHNTIGIVGLSEAVAYILARGIHAMRAHELELCGAMLRGLRERGVRMCDGTGGEGPLAGLRLIGPTEPERRVGVFSLVHDTLAPAEMAVMLEQGFGILARTGITCAPKAHETFGTSGALRLSVGAFNTPEDVAAAVEALVRVCAGVGCHMANSK